MAETQAIDGRPVCRWLRPEDREAALVLLSRDARANLLLLDLVSKLGRRQAPGEASVEVVGAWCGADLIGLAGLRPSIAIASGMTPDVVEALLPHLESMGMGLVKSEAPAVDALWRKLSRGGRRRALVDRTETAYAVRPEEFQPVAESPGAPARSATRADLAPLVIAARESLREENRPDPYTGDAAGFRQWVKGRIPRARLIESEGEVAFVGYADVQLPEGWLLQGVYTWPATRRHGFASYGVSALCSEAFAAGADHVQLAVVDGNEAGRRLYEGLGFRPFSQLRTILFS